MISIRKAGDELDRAGELAHVVRDAYRQAVNSAAQYAIEVNAEDVKTFREHLQVLAELVNGANGPEAWKALQSSFRGELREYRDRATSQVTDLRQQVRAASDAVQLFVENVASIDSDHESQLKGSLRTLNKLASSAGAGPLADAIRVAADTIQESIVLMRGRHQAAIGELRQEIRVLHEHLEGERRAHLTDPATGAWNRHKLDARIGELLKQDRSFCILVVTVRNLARLELRYSRGIVDGALRALSQRFANMLTKETLLGRWDDQNFAAILDLDPSAANALSRLAAKSLANDYSVQENGLSRSVSLQAAAGVVDCGTGCDEVALRKKLHQMMDALAQA